MINPKPISRLRSWTAFMVAGFFLILLATPCHSGVSVSHAKSTKRYYHLKLNQKLKDKKPKWYGYLAENEPSAMRFSDEEATKQRPPSPALPEFTIMSNDHDPYVIERPLPEDTIRAREQLAEVVLELEPHNILSGMIETEADYATKTPEVINIEESRGGTLRSEEVLIFFEAGSEGNEANVLIPFSPAIPSEQTSTSSAKYIREE